MSETMYRGWVIERPDSNSAWWSATRPSGRTTASGQSIPEAVNAGTKRKLLAAIDTYAEGYRQGARDNR